MKDSTGNLEHSLGLVGKQHGVAVEGDTHFLRVLLGFGQRGGIHARCREAAFQRGASFLAVPEGAIQLLTGEARSLAHVNSALDRLAETVPSVRRNILLACAQAAATDGKVLCREAELLRAIAEALDCPMPPFVKALEGEAESL